MPNTLIKTFITCILALILIVNKSFCNTNKTLQLNKSETDKLYKRAIQISTQNPDSSVALISKCKDSYVILSDTSMIVESLFTLIDINRENLNLSKSYDYAWEALLFAEELNNDVYLSQLYQKLGILYSYFNKYKEANKYLQKSISIKKNLLITEKITGQEMIEGYFDLVVLNNSAHYYETANSYLDTCFLLSDQYNQDSIKRGYLFAEYGYVYMRRGEFEKAEETLFMVKELFESIESDEIVYAYDKGYLVILYSFLGDLYNRSNNNVKTIYYYEKSLEAFDKYGAHIGRLSDINLKLSRLYSSQQQYAKAYEALKRSKMQSDNIFGLRSSRNAQLFEVKNKYQEEMRRKNEEINQKNQLLKENRETLSKNRILLFASLLGIVVALLAVYIRNQRLRFRTEKELIAKKTKIKQESAKELIELKNKELTAFTLQFIEKEKVINELLSYIKENPPKSNSYESISRSINKNTSNLWSEFNQRFLAVNDGFYERLREKFPYLSPTDLKHCALIKLNFSGKEMAQLLGISTSSVHISRHRLRKKMNLERSASLSNFIGSI